MQSPVWIYLIRDNDTGYYKIGRSVDPVKRCKDLCKQATQQPTPNDYELIEAWLGEDKDELFLHDYYSDEHQRGEWFALSTEDVRDIYDLMEEHVRLSLGVSDDLISRKENVKDVVAEIIWLEDKIKEQQAHIERLEKRILHRQLSDQFEKIMARGGQPHVI